MTKRVGWLVGALFVVMAAACGDDGNNPSGANECGDGVRAGSETCDDGNTTNDDGCSSTCTLEATGACGDSIISGVEGCDDGNTISGDGCSATCTIEMNPALCGNGAVNPGEACDDGNTVASDGCTACAIDTGYVCAGAPSVCTQLPTPPTGVCTAPYLVTFTTNANGALEGHAIGDTTGSTNQVAASTCSGSVDPAGGGKDHTYKFVLTTTSDVIILGDEKPAFDMVLRLTETACDVTTEVAEYVGADGCTDDDGDEPPPEFLIYAALPAGTYYLDVDGYDDQEEGAYDVTITTRPTTCGDAELDGTEFCDDGNTTAGDGCSARCDIEPGYACEGDAGALSVCTLTCGDGDFDYFDRGEECDDGNTTAGDGCSATCTLEYDTLEVEPNNTTAQLVPTAQGSTYVRGALATATDVDLYAFTLTRPAYVEIETFNANDNADNYAGEGIVHDEIDCYGDIDTQLRLFPNGAAYSDNTTSLFTDEDDGDGACSYLGSFDAAGSPTEGMLQAGTYVIKVTGATASTYLLDIYVENATTPLAGDLVLNELMPADGTADTNCDGATTGTDDEFIELVNDTAYFLDTTGLTVADSLATKFTFAAAASGHLGLYPGEAVVIWSGGAPACAGVTNWFKTTGGLGLNDTGGDAIVVKSGGATPVTLINQTYTTTTSGVSWNLDPDLTGTVYHLHDAITGHVGNYSPGLRTSRTAF